MTTLEAESPPAVRSLPLTTWSGFSVYGRDGWIGIVEGVVRRGDRTALSVRSGLFVQRRDAVPFERVAAVFADRRRLLLRDERGTGER